MGLETRDEHRGPAIITVVSAVLFVGSVVLFILKAGGGN